MAYLYQKKSGRISYIQDKTEKRLCSHSYSIKFFDLHKNIIKETPKKCILCELTETDSKVKKKELMKILLKGLKADRDSDLIPPTKKSKQEVGPPSDPEDLIPNLPFYNMPSGIMKELTRDMNDFQLAAFIVSITRQREIDIVDTDRFLWFEFIPELMKRAKFHMELSLLLLNSGKFSKSVFDEIQNLILMSNIKDSRYMFPKKMKRLILDITNENNNLIFWKFTNPGFERDIILTSILDDHGFNGTLDTLMYYESRNYVKVVNDPDNYDIYDPNERWDGPGLEIFTDNTKGDIDSKTKYDAEKKYILNRIENFMYTGANVIQFPVSTKKLLNSFKSVIINNAFIENYPIFTQIDDTSYDYSDRIESLAVIKNVYAIDFMRKSDRDYAVGLWIRRLGTYEVNDPWKYNFSESKNFSVRDNLIRKLKFFSFIEPYLDYPDFTRKRLLREYLIDQVLESSDRRSIRSTVLIRDKLIDPNLSDMKAEDVLKQKEKLYDDLFTLHIDRYASLYEDEIYRNKTIIFTSYLDSAKSVLSEIQKRMHELHDTHSFNFESLSMSEFETYGRHFRVVIN